MYRVGNTLPEKQTFSHQRYIPALWMGRKMHIFHSEGVGATPSDNLERQAESSHPMVTLMLM